jgi:hypothetical protein
MRRAFSRKAALVLAGLVFMAISRGHGQDDLRASLEHKIEQSNIVVTRFTADHTEIVKAGSVLVFHKRALTMFSIDAGTEATSVYQNGKLTMGFGTSLEAMRTGDNRVPQRTFVEGEKFWLAGTEVDDNAVQLLVISDPIRDVRYQTRIKFPFNRKSPPSADDMMKTISEVVTVDAGDQNTSQQQAAAAPPPPAAAAPAPAPAPMQAIAPPPPPVDAPPAQPKTIAIGQTEDMVTAILGQPSKKVNLGAKHLFIYPDLKVTFVNGKVTDVQ